MARARRLLRSLCLIGGIVSAAVPAAAQTIDDGIMLTKQTLFVGDIYSHDSWDEYWEGALKRDNGNIGTLTTQANVWFGNYGVTDRLNVIASMPYVWTRASQGVLHGLSGLQDITLAAKYNLLERESELGTFRVIGVAVAGIPLTDYNFDFHPLSIGTGSKRVSGRGTVNFQTERGWYAHASLAYTWRAKVTLDRPYYYTDGQLFLTDEVDMPNVVDYMVSGGYNTRRLMATALFSQQRTQGGGDIRRQDMPFVSNRMNFSKVGGMLMYPLPPLRSLAVHAGYTYAINGRNVGQASTISLGLVYTWPFHGRQTP